MSFYSPKPPFVRNFSSPDCSWYRDRQQQEEWSPRSEESDPNIDSDEESHALNIADSPLSYPGSNPLANNLTFASPSLSSSFGPNSQDEVIFQERFMEAKEQSFSRPCSLVIGKRSRPVGLKDVDLTHNHAALYIREARAANRSPKKGQILSSLTRQLSCPSFSHFSHASETFGMSGRLTSKTGLTGASLALPGPPKSRITSTASGQLVNLYSTDLATRMQTSQKGDKDSSQNIIQGVVPKEDKIPFIDLTTPEALPDDERRDDNKVGLGSMRVDLTNGSISYKRSTARHRKPPKKEGLDRDETNGFCFSDDEDSDTGKRVKRKVVKSEPVEPPILEPPLPQEQRPRQTRRHFMMSFMKVAICMTVCVILLSVYLHINPHGFCLESEFHTNISGIEEAFKNELYGQHIAHRIVISALKSHLKKPSGKKPLVLSFHGWTGIGKNFVSNIIAEHFFKQKTRSPFVHKFIVPLHFPHESEIDLYSKQLRGWIQRNVSACKKGALFIFDEMDKIPNAMMNTIRDAILVHRGKTFGADYGNVIFIFLSNSGGHAINQHALKHCIEGKSRESITLSELEAILHNIAEGEPDVWFADLLKLGLVDHIVPFLPLERMHVKQCIRRDLVKKGFDVRETDVTDIADQMEYFPKGLDFFSVTGCKKVSSRVDVAMG